MEFVTLDMHMTCNHGIARHLICMALSICTCFVRHGLQMTEISYMQYGYTYYIVKEMYSCFYNKCMEISDEKF